MTADKLTICERLERQHRRLIPNMPGCYGAKELVNPDGPEAAAIIRQCEDALVEAKRAMWAEARSTWNLADFLNFAAVQQIDAALAKVRTPHHPDEGGRP